MSGRNWAVYSASAALLMFSTLALGGTVSGADTSPSAGSDTTFKILDSTTDPMAWAVWDELANTSDQPCATHGSSDERAKTISRVVDEPTPVAPVPPALVSGGGMILGAGMLKLIRKIRRG